MSQSTFDPSQIQAVTFDCAQTLIAVDWRPAALAVECAAAIGLKFDEVEAATSYDRLLRSRWAEFKELNLAGDPRLTDEFWHRLSLDWAEVCGLPSVKVVDIVAVAEEKLFGPNSSVFALYDDVVPCLQKIRSAGFRTAVISNWDISLHKTLRSFGLDHFFDLVVASLEIGYEKPAPEIFHFALGKLGVEPSQALHVGDNPLDDLRGAKSVGMNALVIDRGEHAPASVYISSLLDLPMRLGL